MGTEGYMLLFYTAKTQNPIQVNFFKKNTPIIARLWKEGTDAQRPTHREFDFTQ